MWSFFTRDPTKDFPFEIGDQISQNNNNLWKIHYGKNKTTNEAVTIFIFDVKNSSQADIELAKASVKRLKTLRHPNILTFLDSAESDKAIYLATESVEPLEKNLQGKENVQFDLSISWGLFQITRALSFLVNDGNLRHNNVHVDSVFVNAGGEWKLGGMDFMSPVASSALAGRSPAPPPEVMKGSGWTKSSVDAYGLGLLIWQVFNNNIVTEGWKTSGKKVPKTLSQTFTELVSQKPSDRPNPADVIVRGRRPGGFFKNDLVDSLLFLEEIQVKETQEKSRFFAGLPAVLDKFPQEICKHKILPQLINAFEFGNAGSAVLTPLFKLGKLLDEAEYQAKIVPCVVKLFSSTDRSTRVRLLQQLDLFADHLNPSTVNDKIFPNIVTGFQDTNPTVREQTVKAMLHLAPKLNFNNLNVELLKHFARLQIRDEQGGIRTNTTICLGKIANYLNGQTRRKVLIPAFTRVFQDLFPQAKIAGILALAATQQYYPMIEISTRILPALSPLTADPDKSVRDAAFKTIKGFLSKLEKVSEDPSLKEKYEADIDAATPSLADSAVGSWAGWAVSALSSKFNRSQSQGATSGAIAGRKGRYPYQSSSSTSTTTSSIPSTPSGERDIDILEPTVEGQESTTDYDEDWDNEDWGSIDEEKESREGKESKTSSPQKNTRDGWDNFSTGEKDVQSGGGWDDDDFIIDDDEPNIPINITSKNMLRNASVELGSSTECETIVSNVPVPDPEEKQEEMRKRREERKLHRQKELETKKSTKSSGPMKLGVKKNVL